MSQNENDVMKNNLHIISRSLSPHVGWENYGIDLYDFLLGLESYLEGRNINPTRDVSYIYPVDKGGYIPAIYLSNVWNVEVSSSLRTVYPPKKILVVSDLCTSTSTMMLVKQDFRAFSGAFLASVYGKESVRSDLDFIAKIYSDETWITFPYEVR